MRAAESVRWVNFFCLWFALVSVSCLRNDKDGPWSASQVLEPAELAKTLKSASRDRQPLLVHVGFRVLYRNARIPGSLYVGPTNEEEGLQRLRSELEKIPREREIVIYCGCCPFVKCPNVRPAFETVVTMGFKNVKVLHIAENLDEDWIRPGYPIEKGEDQQPEPSRANT